ncbi:MAG TPA: AMP-binding protein [Acidimicrobiia bacterium]|jgi:acyl-CoA synthetase (AMP-forming)/AMP-acid ligase II
MIQPTFRNPLAAHYTRPGGPWRDQTLPRLLAESPDRPDLLCAGAARVGTDALRSSVQSIAGGLRARGVRRGGAVTWTLPNGLDVVLLTWATWWLGAVAVPFHPDTTPDERAAVLAHFDAATEVRAEPRRGLASLRGDPVTDPAAAPEDVALVVTTSGSSGTPKSVIHTQRTLAYKARQIREVHRTGTDDAVLVPAPMAHVAGILHGVLHPVATGAKAVIMEKWDAERALVLVRDERVTMLFGPPVYALGIVATPGFTRDAVASVRVISSGGTTITEEFAHRMHDEFGAVVKRAYGSTEAPTITTSFPGDPPALGWSTEGRVVGDAELQVREPESGAVRADGEVGELWLRGPELAEGYLDPGQTAAVFVDGWYRTWDLATIDDGWLRLRGRSADIIIRGGMNVSAAEVENALARHPAVREAVVVGYPDDRLGERIGAFVVVDPGAADAPLDRPACVEWFAAAGVARSKVPDRVVVVDAIPLLPTFQKPDRAELRRRLTDDDSDTP